MSIKLVIQKRRVRPVMFSTGIGAVFSLLVVLPMMAMAGSPRILQDDPSQGATSPASGLAKPIPKTAAVLEEYVRRPDKSFAWKLKDSGETGGTKFAEIILTSQTWRDHVWKHQLFVLLPKGVDPKEKSALFVIAGGRWSDELLDSPTEVPSRRTAIYFAIAEQLQTPMVLLLQVPHQPMFDGRVEDEIIALTFEEYINTKDPTWPVLLPMVKSVVRGMDAAQAYFQDECDLTIDRFTVTGASKRGWTTWLTGAVEPRAAALAPMVIDVLNMSVQMKHQKEVWGQYSDEIGDYTERGLQDLLESHEGQTLREIVDPYSYRAKLGQPKLIFIGTNDAYWPIDALKFYWDDLAGEKHVAYVPNTGHDLADMQRVIGNLNAIHLQTRGLAKMPKFDWSFAKEGEGMQLVIESEEAPDSVSIWYAESDRRDFRQSTWKSIPLKGDGKHFEYVQTASSDKYIAFFGEVRVKRGKLPAFLSTNVQVLEPTESDGALQESPNRTR